MFIHRKLRLLLKIKIILISGNQAKNRKDF
jgi:hypothetical protein